MRAFAAVSAFFVASAISIAARADEPTPIAHAEWELSEGSKAFDAAGKDCATRCKALASMERAAEKICELAKDGSEADHARCASAKKEVERAREILRLDCPDCVMEAPTPPNVVTAPPPPPRPQMMDASKGTTVFAGAGSVAMPEAEATSYRLPPRLFTVRTSILRPIEAPPFLARVSFEVAVIERASFTFHVGGGSVAGSANALGDVGARNPSMAVFETGVEARGYLFGGFSHGGLALGLQLLETRVAVKHALTDSAPASDFLLPGVTFAPLAAYKIVFPLGLTLDASLGAAFSTHREAPREANERKVVPLADFAVGWSF